MGTKIKEKKLKAAWEGYPLGREQLDKIDNVFCCDFASTGIQSALLIDMAGNIISKYDSGNCHFDLRLFAALASANFAAVDSMARTVGEKEFSLLFHKGKKSSTHFSRINNEFVLVATFGMEVPIGALRQKITEVSEKIKRVWD